ncbi:MAG: diguanylate cyclase [Anaerolineales bacterium]|nr:diguanylate cyclase [Anaerolineales bacterium]
MKGKKNITDQAAYLRQRAEEIARENTLSSHKNVEDLSPEEMRQVLHELRVHQIELEMQNEELRRIQVELEAAKSRYFDLYDLAPIGYCTLNKNGLILENNLTAAALLGVARSKLLKIPITRFIHKEDQDIYYLHLKQLFKTGKPQATDLRMVKEDGTIFWVHLAATVMQPAVGAPVCQVMLVDISAQKLAEIKLQYLSMHDALTGLYNRSFFEETMNRFESGRQTPISILMIDVDKLKVINDNQGHAAGDALLKRVAHLLTASFRTEDIIARIGGDEFAILMPGATESEAEAVLHRFLHSLRNYNVANPDTPLQLSCGLCSSETKSSLIETLRKADANMYLEKRGRKDTLAEDHTDPTRSEQVLRRRAEETSGVKATMSPEDMENLSPEEIRLTFQELRVYQIELEMQNEELYRSLEELQTARDRYLDLYNLAPVGYCTLSEKGMILESNFTTAGLLNTNPSALLNCPITRFIHKDDQDIFYQHSKLLFKTGITQVFELRMVKEDGTEFWGYITAAHAQDAASEPVGRIILNDITERKQTEEALIAAHKDLQQLLKASDRSR